MLWLLFYDYCVERESRKFVYKGDSLGGILCYNAWCNFTWNFPYFHFIADDIYLDKCLSSQGYKLEWWIRKVNSGRKRPIIGLLFLAGGNLSLSRRQLFWWEEYIKWNIFFITTNKLKNFWGKHKTKNLVRGWNCLDLSVATIK